ncbi:histidine phosphatase family protein [Eleftheria terrae]|uniref:histidine phosphatase family protein n=1 Tax=Eleftheria terrae TaxID=1597781 RepID=UPI00263A58B2|nr:histidine phosphatase family protein [Eleftheria terrae]WKB54891.1 histidine phosphatase family protein [Eleftheria terrae]
MPHRELTRVIAIRHGETAWNLDARLQGHLDIPLNDTGRWQAARVAQALSEESLDAIYASDLSRAHETAQAIAAVAGLPVQRDAGLRERGFGEFEGMTYREIEERWPDRAMRWRKRDPLFGPAGGESLTVFYERVIACASRLAAQHGGQTIALVAHGGVLDCLYRAASRVDLQAARTWELGNASINRLLYTPEGFMLVGWADTSHLTAETLDEGSDGAGITARG